MVKQWPAHRCRIGSGRFVFRELFVGPLLRILDLVPICMRRSSRRFTLVSHLSLYRVPCPPPPPSDMAGGGASHHQEDQLAGASVSHGSVVNSTEGDAVVEHSKAPVAACCICMEPWTSGGEHRAWYVRTYSYVQLPPQNNDRLS